MRLVSNLKKQYQFPSQKWF